VHVLHVHDLSILRCERTAVVGHQPISAGIFGMPAGFAGVIIGSLLTAAPGKDVQEMVDHVRYPNLDR